MRWNCDVFLPLFSLQQIPRHIFVFAELAEGEGEAHKCSCRDISDLSHNRLPIAHNPTSFEPRVLNIIDPRNLVSIGLSFCPNFLLALVEFQRYLPIYSPLTPSHDLRPTCFLFAPQSRLITFAPCLHHYPLLLPTYPLTHINLQLPPAPPVTLSQSTSNERPKEEKPLHSPVRALNITQLRPPFFTHNPLSSHLPINYQPPPLPNLHLPGLSPSWRKSCLFHHCLGNHLDLNSESASH